MALDAIEVFVAVVEAQSFSRAAIRLGMPATTVSAKVAELERRLRVTLIRRTTRQMHVTAAGQGYYAQCAQALATIAAAERELAEAMQEPSGLLRITAPADLVNGLLTPLVERYLARYPKTSVAFKVTNRVVDLVAEGMDLAVRVGKLEASSLVVRSFRSGQIGLFAARDYLDRHGTPQTEAELAGHAVIGFSRFGPPALLRAGSGETIAVNLAGRLASDDLDHVKNLILRGNGIGLLPTFVETAIETRSTLVRVLPDYATETFSVHFAYPAQRFVPPTVRAFIALAMS